MSKSELVTMKIFKGMFEGLVDEVQRTNKAILKELEMHVAAMDKLDDRLDRLSDTVSDIHISLNRHTIKEQEIEKRLDNHGKAIDDHIPRMERMANQINSLEDSVYGN